LIYLFVNQRKKFIGSSELRTQSGYKNIGVSDDLVLLHTGIVYDTYPKVNPNLNVFLQFAESVPTACVTGWREGLDNARKREKSKPRKCS
jgi:hypothetical protein